MAQIEVKKFRLEPDRRKTRKLILDDAKLSDLHEPTKVYKNPMWPIALEDTITVSDIKYDLDAIIVILDQAGVEVGKLDKLVESGVVTNRRPEARKIDSKLAIDLHPHLKDIPRKILFDNQFWYYLYMRSPSFGVHRYETSKNDKGEYQSQDRLWGDWRRIPYSWAYLSYYLADEVNISASQFKSVGSRLRMWILDQSPLISMKLRKVFIEHVITGGKGQDDRLNNTWPKIAMKLGSLNLDLLDDSDVKALFATL